MSNNRGKIIFIVVVSLAILVALIKIVILPTIIQSQTPSIFDNIEEELDSTEINAFNSSFTNYSGTQNGIIVKSLIQTVQINNSSSNKMISINFNGTTYSSSDVSSVSTLINSSNTYNVTFGYDSQGYINTISIK